MIYDSLFENISFYLAVLILLFYLVAGIDAFFGARTIKFLRNCPAEKMRVFPRVSVVIAARNERRHIETALQSVLSQDYPALEIIVVDDRSTDGTSAILDRISLKHAHLKSYHISDLPEGWLGKNHALFFGSGKASGDYLLFMDADVLMAPTTIIRTIGFMIEKRLDHVTLFPELPLKGILLNMVVGVFAILFILFTRPWQAKNPSSAKHIGIGAFNLVRAKVYREVGSHQAIAMRPDDDMKLAKLIKKKGFRQDCLLGKGMVSVEWYRSVRELIQGLEKNAFASFNYHLSGVIVATAMNLLMFVWPFIGIVVTSGMTQLIYMAALGILALFYVANATFQGMNPWYGLGFPVANLIFIYILWVSTLNTLLKKGIVWRGTYYSLAKLKANKV
jgi:glycosyltransferase involved in cell wall biosynthesis